MLAAKKALSVKNLDKPHNEWVRGFLDYELWDGKSSFVPTFCLAYRQTQWTQIIHQSNYHCLPEVGLGVMQPTHTFQRPRHMLRRRALWRGSSASIIANIFFSPRIIIFSPRKKQRWVCTIATIAVIMSTLLTPARHHLNRLLENVLSSTFWGRFIRFLHS